MPVQELVPRIREALNTKRVFKDYGIEYFASNIPLGLLSSWSDRPTIPNSNFLLSPVSRARLDLLHRESWKEVVQKDYIFFKRATAVIHPPGYTAKLSLYPTAGQGGIVWQYEIGTEEEKLIFYQDNLYPEKTRGRISKRDISQNTEGFFNLLIQHALETH